MLQVLVGAAALLAGGLILWTGPSGNLLLIGGILAAIGALLLIHAVLGLGRGRHRG